MTKPHPGALLEQLDRLSISVWHHFAGGCYAKETRIPAGTMMGQHKHRHDHLAILAKGSTVLYVEERTPRLLDAPAIVRIPADLEHQVEATTDAVWFCIWTVDPDAGQDDESIERADAARIKGD